MGPIRNPRWEQKQTEGYVIISMKWHHQNTFTWCRGHKFGLVSSLWPFLIGHIHLSLAVCLYLPNLISRSFQCEFSWFLNILNKIDLDKHNLIIVIHDTWQKFTATCILFLINEKAKSVFTLGNFFGPIGRVLCRNWFSLKTHSEIYNCQFYIWKHTLELDMTHHCIWFFVVVVFLVAGQISPKPNRSQVKSAPDQIIVLLWSFFYCFTPFFHTGKSHVRQFCCLLLSTCKVKYFLNSLDTIQQNI